MNGTFLNEMQSLIQTFEMQSLSHSLTNQPINQSTNELSNWNRLLVTNESYSINNEYLMSPTAEFDEMIINEEFFTQKEQKTKERQMENYKKGTALIFSVHITHHAGTYLCRVMRHFGQTQDFACQGGANWANFTSANIETWNFTNTADKVMIIQPHFHYISQEFRFGGSKNMDVLHDIFWEYENLVSIIVMRHPIDRFLSCGKNRGGDPNTDNQALYWEYANSDYANNYALRALSSNKYIPNCRANPIQKECLESAKKLLRRFTFVIDQNCVHDSLLAIAKELGLKEMNATLSGMRQPRFHKPASERISNRTLYNFIAQRFRLDIELYEWSKKLSIVKCTL